MIDKNDKINVIIYVGLAGDTKVLASHIKKDLLKEESLTTKEEEIFEVKFVFRRPSYRDDMDIIAESVTQKFDIGGESISMNPGLIRYSRFTQLLVGWDLTDEDDEKIDPTIENIDDMHPTLDEAANVGLEEMLTK